MGASDGKESFILTPSRLRISLSPRVFLGVSGWKMFCDRGLLGKGLACPV